MAIMFKNTCWEIHKRYCSLLFFCNLSMSYLFIMFLFDTIFPRFIILFCVWCWFYCSNWFNCFEGDDHCHFYTYLFFSCSNIASMKIGWRKKCLLFLLYVKLLIFIHFFLYTNPLLNKSAVSQTCDILRGISTNYRLS